MASTEVRTESWRDFVKAVSEAVSSGREVVLEAGAGLAATFSDPEDGEGEL